MSTLWIRFRVHGVPKPGGSKRSFIVGLKKGQEFDPKRHRAIITDDCKTNMVWRESVKEAALRALEGMQFAEASRGSALRLDVEFIMPRPKGHYGTGRNADVLKDWAPKYHTSKPDATKLLRSTEDALTGILWADDSAIAEQRVTKIYSNDGTVGAIVSLYTL